MKIFLETLETACSYVGGGYSNSQYRLHLHHHPGGDEGLIKETITDVEYDTTGNARSGSGATHTVHRYVTP